MGEPLDQFDQSSMSERDRQMMVVSPPVIDEEQREELISPEIREKLKGLKYMLDHWRDPNEILTPEWHGTRGASYGEDAERKLGTEDILNRDVYFHETGWYSIQRIAESSFIGTVGIMPFYKGQFRNRERDNPVTADQIKIEETEVISEEKLQNAIENPDRIHECLVFGGAAAETLSDVATKYKDELGGSYKGSYSWKHGELGRSDPRHNLRDLYKSGQVVIHPSALMLGVSSTEYNTQDFLNKRLKRIQAAEETIRHMKNNGLEELIVDPNSPHQNHLQVTTVEKLNIAISEAKSEIQAIKENAKLGGLRAVLAKRMGEEVNLPVFDLQCNMLWPKKMPYEQVKQYIDDLNAPPPSKRQSFLSKLRLRKATNTQE